VFTSGLGRLQSADINLEEISCQLVDENWGRREMFEFRGAEKCSNFTNMYDIFYRMDK
jgi:hypothetical protein